MTDARTADYARAREAFAALATEEKIGFLLDASFLTAARTLEAVGERLSEELGTLVDALRRETARADADAPADEDDADGDGIEPTTERASDEVERMLDDLFGPDDGSDADPSGDEGGAPDELPPL